MVDRKDQDTTPENDFARPAEQASGGLISEFIGFLIDNKKWWLAPIILCLLVIGVLVLLTGGAAAPFIYTLF
ncbi:MAG: DUF5989 family protein [Planctomycetota bacterium]|jgi:hypothetical protein